MEKNQPGFPLEKQNYLIIIAGALFVVTGFIFMAGGGNEDPNVFNEEELFSPIRIRFAPFLVILGYVVVLAGIIRKPKA